MGNPYRNGYKPLCSTTFRHWCCCRYGGRYSAVLYMNDTEECSKRHFVCSMMKDKKFPNSQRKSVHLNYLQGKRILPNALNAFHMLWNEYEETCIGFVGERG